MHSFKLVIILMLVDWRMLLTILSVKDLAIILTDREDQPVCILIPCPTSSGKQLHAMRKTSSSVRKKQVLTLEFAIHAGN